MKHLKYDRFTYKTEHNTNGDDIEFGIFIFWKFDVK